MTSDDFLQRVEKKVLSLRVSLDLGENEGKVLLQIASTDTACKARHITHSQEQHHIVTYPMHRRQQNELPQIGKKMSRE